MEINILLFIVIAIAVFKAYDGCKKGMVKEIISFLSLIFLSLLVVLLGNAISSYNDGKILNVAVMVLLLGVLGIVHHLINLVLLPAKIIAKLPVVKSLDKVMGILVGIMEAVLILWIIYTFAKVMNLGVIGDYILQDTSKSRLLTWLYEHNQLAGWLRILGARLQDSIQNVVL